MNKNSRNSPPPNGPDSACLSGRSGSPVGIFWDQSLVWGLLCIETFRRSGVSFRLLGAADIAAGALDEVRILLVPGGWAAHKVRALGESGREKVAAFIDGGGSYIGFCGGAGMALSSPPALHLTPIERMPLSERLPSASGRINVCGTLSHPAWKDVPEQIPVSVWWPSQFRWNAGPGAPGASLAVYADPCADFQVADLRVADVSPEVCWKDLEAAYGINLDPARIKGHPAVIEVRRGAGRMVLSYAHLETPGDAWANRLLLNILDYLDEESAKAGKEIRKPVGGAAAHEPEPELPGEAAWAGIARAREAAVELVSFGEANLLWNWRNPWLLNWRRGIRGLEYGSLFVTLDRMAALRKRIEPGGGGGRGPSVRWPRQAEILEKRTVEFCTLARRLLLEEKIAAQTGIVKKLGKVNERVDHLRSSLFGDKMNHGGLSRALFDLVDSMLLDLLRQAR